MSSKTLGSGEGDTVPALCRWSWRQLKAQEEFHQVFEMQFFGHRSYPWKPRGKKFTWHDLASAQGISVDKKRIEMQISVGSQWIRHWGQVMAVSYLYSIKGVGKHRRRPRLTIWNQRWILLHVAYCRRAAGPKWNWAAKGVVLAWRRPWDHCPVLKSEINVSGDG